MRDSPAGLTSLKSSMDNVTTDLLPLGTMAAMVGVTQKWLRREAEAGRIPCLNADGRLLFDEATVQRLLRDRATNREEVDDATS